MTSRLDDTSATPLYAQLMTEIEDRIRQGSYVVGERIPSEEKLIEEFGVSRITVRRAIKELVARGLLEKHQGKGTFVKRGPGASKSAVRVKFEQNRDVSSFTAQCAENGLRAGAVPVLCEEVAGLEEAQDFFGFGPEGRLLRIDRVRTADDLPIMLEENYFLPDVYAYLADAPLRDTSLFQIMAEHGAGDPCLLEPCSLDIERASVGMAELLDVAPDEPLFLYIGRYFDDGGRPMYYGKQHIVSSRYTFRL